MCFLGSLRRRLSRFGLRPCRTGLLVRLPELREPGISPVNRLNARDYRPVRLVLDRDFLLAGVREDVLREDDVSIDGDVLPGGLFRGGEIRAACQTQQTEKGKYFVHQLALEP